MSGEERKVKEEREEKESLLLLEWLWLPAICTTSMAGLKLKTCGAVISSNEKGEAQEEKWS